MGETLQILPSHNPYSAGLQTSPPTALGITGERPPFRAGLALGMPRTEFFKIRVKVADALGKQKPCVCHTVFQE